MALQQLGRMGPDRTCWLDVNRWQFVLYEKPRTILNDEGEILGKTHMLQLAIAGPGRKPVTMGLSSLTAEELRELRKFLNLALDKAEPTCENLDRWAREAFENGDDAFTRLYRPVPAITYRGRPGEEHDEGLPSGPETATRLRSVDFGRDDATELGSEVRGEDGEVSAEQDPGDGQAADS